VEQQKQDPKWTKWEKKEELTVLRPVAIKGIVIPTRARRWIKHVLDIIRIVAQVGPGVPVGILAHDGIDGLDSRRRVRVGDVGAEVPELGVEFLEGEFLPRFRDVVHGPAEGVGDGPCEVADVGDGREAEEGFEFGDGGGVARGDQGVEVVDDGVDAVGAVGGGVFLNGEVPGQEMLVDRSSGVGSGKG
jgi:hypothetical protein